MGKATPTAAMRWHNPGNISKLPNGQKYKGEVPRPGRFAGGESDFAGLRMIAMTLLAYEIKHGIKTINDSVHRYAPPSENLTKEYVKNVSSWTGIPATKQISLAANLEKLIPAHCHQENGAACPLDYYSPELIHEAAEDARRAYGM